MQTLLTIFAVVLIVTVAGVVYVKDAVNEARKKVLEQRGWIGYFFSEKRAK